MPFCSNCSKFSEDSDGSRFCRFCGSELAPPSTKTYRPSTTKSRSSMGTRAAVAIVFLVVVFLGWIAFTSLACSTSYYTGYIKTADGSTINIDASYQIVSMHYDKGVLLYTVYLTSRSGQTFEYHYVTDFNLQRNVPAICPGT